MEIKCYGSMFGSNPSGVGSTPTISASLLTEMSKIKINKYRDVAQLVEHRSPKPSVAGSSPVILASEQEKSWELET